MGISVVLGGPIFGGYYASERSDLWCAERYLYDASREAEKHRLKLQRQAENFREVGDNDGLKAVQREFQQLATDLQNKKDKLREARESLARTVLRDVKKSLVKAMSKQAASRKNCNITAMQQAKDEFNVVLRRLDSVESYWTNSLGLEKDLKNFVALYRRKQIGVRPRPAEGRCRYGVGFGD